MPQVARRRRLGGGGAALSARPASERAGLRHACCCIWRRGVNDPGVLGFTRLKNVGRAAATPLALEDPARSQRYADVDGAALEPVPGWSRSVDHQGSLRLRREYRLRGW